jgi:hypothetical protein
MSRVCFWSVATGDYAAMVNATIHSARAVGVENDFHVWSDRDISGAITHPVGNFRREGWLFKFTFLRDAVQKLDYDYFAWIDTDTYFVRNPGNVLRHMHGSPLHIALECDVLAQNNIRTDWWGCPNKMFAKMMWRAGVRSRRIYNVNGGFAIVHRHAVETVFKLAMDFYSYGQECSYQFVDEQLWSYAMHMLCADTQIHTLTRTCDLWASDWTGEFADALPTGTSWQRTDYFTSARSFVNPPIVHAMRSKAALIREGAVIASGITERPNTATLPGAHIRA